MPDGEVSCKVVSFGAMAGVYPTQTAFDALNASVATNITNTTANSTAITTIQSKAALGVASATDQAVTNSAVLVNSQLTLNLEANSTYMIQAHVPFSIGLVGGYRFAFTGPTSPTAVQMSAIVLSDNETLVQVQALNAFGVNVTGVLAVASTHATIFSGVVVVGASAGAVTLQFAQSLGNGTPITIKRGAIMRAMKVT